MNALIYDNTGKILKSLSMPPEFYSLQLNVNEFLYTKEVNLQDNLDLYFIVNNSLTIRPTQLTTLDKTTITANGVDIISITNAPDGTFTAVNTVTKDTITGPINGSDTFSTTIAGTYKITIVAWPYLDFETTIEAV